MEKTSRMTLRGILKGMLERLPLKRELFTFLRLFSLPEKLFRHLYFHGWFQIRMGDSQFAMYHYGYELENKIFWKGLEGWEKTSIGIWIMLSRKAGFIVDVGANTGVFALVAKAANPSAVIYAFEPVERILEKFNRNVEANRFAITGVCKGLSNFEGEATIFDLPSEHVYSVTVNKNLNPGGQTVIPRKIQVTTLDNFVRQENLQRIDLLKIDVETHEPEVLEGALQTLEKWKPAIVMEILTEEVAKRVTHVLRGFDYVYFELNDDKGPILRTEIKPHQHLNYLACARNEGDNLLRMWNEREIH